MRRESKALGSVVGCLVVLLGSAITVPVAADCGLGKGLACFPVFSSCGFTAGLAGRDPYIQCVDTLSKHWCTECVTTSDLDPRAVVCPNGGGLAAKLTDCPGANTRYLSSQMYYAGRTVAPNQDGRLEMAVTGPGGTTSHLWQQSSGSWVADAVPFPGNVHAASFPAVVRHFDGRLDVFVITAAGTVAHSKQAGPNVNWAAWVNIGGALRTGGIAANVDQAGHAVVAGVGKDSALWYAVEKDDGSFASWQSLGGSFAGAPVIALNADGRLEIFAVAAGGGLSHCWQSPGSAAFQPWVSLGNGPFTGTPSVARNLDQRLEVFITTRSGALAHAWQLAPNGGWSVFDQPEGLHAHDPAVAMNADGTLDVFVVGVNDRALWHRRQVAPNTGWGNWESLGGVALSTPAVARNAHGTLEVLVVGQDGAIWEIHQQSPAGAKWTGWARIGGRAQPNLL